MQIEYGCIPFIVLVVFLCVAFGGIHLIRGKSDGNDIFGKENWGKVILGFCVCAAVPLTMDSVVTFSPENITINFWAWRYYSLISMITVLCSGALMSLYKK